MAEFGRRSGVLNVGIDIIPNLINQPIQHKKLGCSFAGRLFRLTACLLCRFESYPDCQVNPLRQETGDGSERRATLPCRIMAVHLTLTEGVEVRVLTGQQRGIDVPLLNIVRWQIDARGDIGSAPI